MHSCLSQAWLHHPAVQAISTHTHTHTPITHTPCTQSHTHLCAHSTLSLQGHDFRLQVSPALALLDSQFSPPPGHCPMTPPAQPSPSCKECLSHPSPSKWAWQSTVIHSPGEPCLAQLCCQGWAEGWAAGGWGPHSTYCVDPPQQPLRQNRRRGCPARRGRRGNPGGTSAPWRLSEAGSQSHGTPLSPASCPILPSLGSGAWKLIPAGALSPHLPRCVSRSAACRQSAHLSTEQPRRAGQAPSGPCGGC